MFCDFIISFTVNNREFYSCLIAFIFCYDLISESLTTIVIVECAQSVDKKTVDSLRLSTNLKYKLTSLLRTEALALSVRKTMVSPASYILRSYCLIHSEQRIRLLFNRLHLGYRILIIELY